MPRKSAPRTPPRPWPSASRDAGVGGGGDATARWVATMRARGGASPGASGLAEARASWKESDALRVGMDTIKGGAPTDL
eukprot:CAMPEP_0206026668 /NCGR_PEP_ID=MMETSP1464-20131121/42037_2 /ASSEMBLY_ACC=CAM_ASM_001124 /TAXON_ID=119497 /ORGANISM="Exanthemachrysis gayraliae, Strain RCC1523" /LENGTH=78 /DNA_ID=CAMNT_0053400711 /DNA_START=213 /DNA_END=445 /DNA_ORIENTATION=-